MIRSLKAAAALAIALGVATGVVTSGSAAAEDALNDFPTVARADYVLGCMAANGQSRKVLEQCSCSIDHIATILTYEHYVEAETMLRTLQVGGERVAAMRGSARHNAIVDELRRAQAEADLVCF
ncbi:MAG: hypothetical protein AAF371_03440 [Pseudomonadota bacterium]